MEHILHTDTTPLDWDIGQDSSETVSYDGTLVLNGPVVEFSKEDYIYFGIHFGIVLVVTIILYKIIKNVLNKDNIDNSIK